MVWRKHKHKQPTCKPVWRKHKSLKIAIAPVLVLVLVLDEFLKDTVLGDISLSFHDLKFDWLVVCFGRGYQNWKSKINCAGPLVLASRADNLN